MNILAAILILGATGSAQRSMVVEQEPIGIVVRVIIGGVGDVLNSDRSDRGLQVAVSTARRTLATAELTIDNEPRTGWRAWGAAAVRVGAYAADARSDGSVVYEYQLRVRRYLVRRSTAISDGNVALTTDAWWTETVPVGRRMREIPIHVTITIRAEETRWGTVLHGLARGTADTSDFRCGRVRFKHAEPEATATLNRELSNALVVIESKGTDWYHGADQYTDILDSIGTGMRTIGPRIGSRR